MSEKSIKVTIGNRVYPLTISSSEEDSILKSVKMVNDNMRELEQNYSVRDKQDLLAMTALFYASQASKDESSTESSEDELNQKLKQFSEQIKQHLSQLDS